jgi:hypothetical protein
MVILLVSIVALIVVLRAVRGYMAKKALRRVEAECKATDIELEVVAMEQELKSKETKLEQENDKL